MLSLYGFIPGERTFGVLTKIDLMDKGTDAVDVSFQCPLSLQLMLSCLTNVVSMEQVNL